MATPIEQLDAMKSLPENWDGYGADALQPRLVDLAKDFVLFFQSLERATGSNLQILVHPTRVGGVQIEWTDAVREHELEINPDGSIGMLHIDRATGTMVEERFEPTIEPSAIAPGLIGRLAKWGIPHSVA